MNQSNSNYTATSTESFSDLYNLSLNSPSDFWAKQAERIYWHKQPEQILDDSKLPFAKWFVGGETNLCYNCVDRHLQDRAEQDAFVWVSSEINQELLDNHPGVAEAFKALDNHVEFYTDYAKRRLTYNRLYKEVNYFADVLQRLGVGKGDRVVIYMPMILEAAYAMLACVRIGAIHSVVFGGFAAHNLAVRIDDSEAKMVITVDAGLRGGKIINYKNLVNQGVEQAQHKPEKVLVVDRGILPFEPQPIDIDFATERRISCDNRAVVEPVWLESNEPSYLLYTSGTTGTPKGVQRDTGGYAVALTTTMDYIYDGNPGETFWAISDIGWAVGHSYTIYAPLLAGLTSVMYEGLPHNPNPGIWWRIVEANKVNILFTAPTGVRMLKKQDETWLTRYDTSSVKSFFLAGEPLDEPTGEWLSEHLGVPIIDHYWQTETGWPILSHAPKFNHKPHKAGTPGYPMYGYNAKVLHEETGEPCQPGEKGLLAIAAPLPPGCLTTVWRNDERFIKSYYNLFNGKQYSSSDYAVIDEEGYYHILGRTDDVINVAGHRLGTQEIEAAISEHPEVAEVGVVGIKDELKGELPIAFCILRDPSIIDDTEGRFRVEQQIMGVVARSLGALARPAAIYFPKALPKTRSGKILRRAIRALAEGKDTGDMSTLEDPTAIDAVKAALDSY
ncbi:propionate--CoA ligase [Psychrobacter phenylpyruvicus]|uniref:Acetyl-coenzyme A synthetase n=1 Tax=Psychrobacter phenylpyruvicus TaxID=29432 RepID=A0A379LMA8_9GAMM|nr:propionate--CoA ligase [Psychrobacter phenylpyruvicus]SUD91736.1 Acetyl-coenzyme A synthetase [Psychrobacter phenylpyruvicus]